MISKTLLLDADVLCHQLAYSNTSVFAYGDVMVETISPEKAKNDCEHIIISLKETLGADMVLLCLSDRGRNFRKDFDPTYKSNRTTERPTLWHTIREFIESRTMEYPVIHLPRLEGDDILGILMTQPGVLDTRIMVSIDKDMRTIPGRLYNPQKPDLGTIPISQQDADLFWMTQTLTGDAVDGYPGLRGCGPKRAKVILDGLVELEEMWTAVLQAFADKGHTADHALNQARLARILRHDDYNRDTGEIILWTPSF